MPRRATTAPSPTSASAPSPVSPPNAESLLNEMTALAGLFRTNFTLIEGKYDSLVETTAQQVESLGTIVLSVQAMAGLLEDFMARLDTQVESLLTATTALVEVHNNMVEMMAEP